MSNPDVRRPDEGHAPETADQGPGRWPIDEASDRLLTPEVLVKIQDLAAESTEDATTPEDDAAKRNARRRNR